MARPPGRGAGRRQARVATERASLIYTSASPTKRGKNDRRKHLHVTVHGSLTRDANAPDHKKLPPDSPPLPFPSTIHHHTAYPPVLNNSPSSPHNEKWASHKLVRNFLPRKLSINVSAPTVARLKLTSPDPTETRTRTARKATTEKRTKKGEIPHAYILVSVVLSTDPPPQIPNRNRRSPPAPITSS